MIRYLYIDCFDNGKWKTRFLAGSFGTQAVMPVTQVQAGCAASTNGLAFSDSYCAPAFSISLVLRLINCPA